MSNQQEKATRTLSSIEKSLIILPKKKRNRSKSLHSSENPLTVVIASVNTPSKKRRQTKLLYGSK